MVMEQLAVEIVGLCREYGECRVEVLQDVNLFTGTIMENIRYGRLDATDEEVIAAAKLANLQSQL